jgi:hypothetical protein
MYSKLLVVLLAVALVGCDATTVDVSRDFQLPEELKDCRIIELRPDGGDSTRVHIIKCPEGYLTNSTTYSEGKTHATSTVVVL